MALTGPLPADLLSIFDDDDAVDIPSLNLFRCESFELGALGQAPPASGRRSGNSSAASSDDEQAPPSAPPATKAAPKPKPQPRTKSKKRKNGGPKRRRGRPRITTDPVEQAKRAAIRREKNRQSAIDSRNRKQAYVLQLETQVSSLSARNADLERMVAGLRRQVAAFTAGAAAMKQEGDDEQVEEVGQAPLDSESAALVTAGARPILPLTQR